MARISRAVRETINTILVILAVLIVVFIYLVYPLNRTKAFMARPETEGETSDSLMLPNDLTSFTEAGLTADSLRIESDGITKLAAASLLPKDSVPRGLAILIPSEQRDRSQVVNLAKVCLDSGLAVVTYDQRATGSSTGIYRSDGQQEATDLEAVIAYLEIHGQIHHPLVVVGYNAGGDAALLTAIEETRIDALAAVSPYLTTDRMIDELRKTKSLVWFPFYRTMFWWWYDIRSSYAAAYRNVADLKAPSVPAILVVDAAQQSEASVQTLSKAATEPLTVKPVTISDAELIGSLLALARK